MKITFFDCFSGISGDMTLGALIDLGVDPIDLASELDKLRLEEFHATDQLEFEKVSKHAISATHVKIRIEDDHDHPHRHLNDIFQILDSSELSDEIKKTSKKIFDRLATAEAKVHNVPKEKVHLHEVSGTDAIIDIVGSVIALKMLEIDEIYSSPISLGSGFVKCDHGTMPIPVPGTIEILRGVPIRQTAIRKELTTPTGAAIIRSLAIGFGPMPEMVIDRIGYGAGTRDLEEVPNLLRIIVGEKTEKKKILTPIASA